MTKKNSTHQDAANVDLVSAVLATIGDPAQVRELLLFLCSPSELKSIGKRMEIISLLKEGASYTEIQSALKVSSATVSKVAQINHSTYARKLLRVVSQCIWAQQQANSVRKRTPRWLQPFF